MISRLLENIRPADVVDITIVAALIYAFIVGFRRNKAAFVITGVAIVSAFYLVARTVEMHLVTFLLQGFATIFLIALVVIFQEELRRFFEQVALWGLKRKRKDRRGGVQRPQVESLVSALAKLSRERIGALIVLQGNDSVSRHLHGGIELNGALSEAVLESLFDPHSAGHDGAVIVVGDRVVQFASHLPLSNDTEALAGRGTRHAAALGLSERADALCLVVSEERGTISFVRHGKLEVASDPARWTAKLEAFFREIAPPRERRRLRDVLLKNVQYKVMAALVAGVLWFLFVHESTIEYRSFRVPVEFRGLAPGLTVRSTDPRLAKVVVSGPRRSFYFVNGKRFAVKVNLFDVEQGRREINLVASDATIPGELTFVSLTPARIAVEIERQSEIKPRGND